jgi:hypothetical protein
VELHAQNIYIYRERERGREGGALKSRSITLLMI